MQFYIMNNCVEVAEMISEPLAEKFYKQLDSLTRTYQANGGQMLQLQ